MEDAPATVTVVKIPFTVDGLRLEGWLHRPDGPRPPLVVGVHGLLSDADSPKQTALAAACCARGMAYFRFHHRGCGTSQGDLVRDTNLDNRVADLRQAVDTLAARQDTGRLLGLFGSSLGGTTCLAAAAALRPAGMVTFGAPVASRPLAQARRHGTDPVLARLDLSFDISHRLQGIDHLLVVHGENDEVVPLDSARTIHRLAQEPKQILVQAGGDHRMSHPEHQHRFVEEVVAWFQHCFAMAQ